MDPVFAYGADTDGQAKPQFLALFENWKAGASANWGERTVNSTFSCCTSAPGTEDYEFAVGVQPEAKRFSTNDARVSLLLEKLQPSVTSIPNQIW
jgi:hypothetical protein